VDPSITAACITGGVGALGIVGTIIGSRSGIASTMATLAAAREERLWEKRAAVYEETLAAVLHRNAQHRHELRTYRLDDESEQLLDDLLASYDRPGWFEAEARLFAYASDRVVAAFEETERAKIEVSELYRYWQALAGDNRLAAESGNPSGAHDSEVVIKARRDVDDALEVSAKKDAVLIALMRDELRSKPDAAMVPATVPAKLHKIWHRHRE
jgi:hypothetical protein